MSPLFSFFRILLVLNLVFLFFGRANAQIKPDSTLGNESSTLAPNQTINRVNSNVISGGAVRGTNLFHSFENFNINSGQGAYFINPLGVTNILTRVTGNNPSNIFGVLGVLGNANLFFINPHGVIFGPNASLALNGSFLASTANTINLPGGTVFAATDPHPVPPLLTINVPIGLSFTGGVPGSIEVQGIGHNLLQPFSVLLPSKFLGPVRTGLELKPGHTLALVGGDINFTGGIVTAPSGRIELGSVASGQVSITPNSSEGISLSYEKVQGFQNILLARQSLANASGFENGDIRILGKNVEFTDKSLVFVQNQGSNSLGAINVNASNSLIVTGATQFTPILFASGFPLRALGGIVSEALFSGKGADINISTKQLVVQNAGFIGTNTFGSDVSGNITINASDSIQILGNSPFDSTYPLGSIINSETVGQTRGAGRAGNVIVITKQIFNRDGGSLGSVTLGNGAGGDVSVNASDAINLIGFEPVSLIGSIISSAAQGSGNGGNLFVNTKRLTLQNGGRIDASTLTSGAAGNLLIDATDIKVSGTIPNSVNSSLIISSAALGDQSLREALQLKGGVTGSSGNITIKTIQLRVTDGAAVTVRNDGTGKAGSLQINANSINLDNQGGITASTTNGLGGEISLHLSDHLSLDHNSLITATAGGQGAGGNITIDPQQTIISNGSGIAVNSTGTGRAGVLKISSNSLTLNNGGFLSANTNGGEGGNIFLNAQNLQLRHSSLFTAAAQGSGNGGNININTGTLAALENSRISADAVRGKGGNIQINAQGLFQSPDSKFTASSNLGINGTVQVKTLVNNSTLGLVRLPIVPVDAAKLIAQGCGGNAGPRDKKFVVTGSGGFPSSPTDSQDIDRSESDWGTTNATDGENHASTDRPSKSHNDDDDDFVEATGAIRNAKGQIELVANAPTYTPAPPWIKPAGCRAH